MGGRPKLVLRWLNRTKRDRAKTARSSRRLRRWLALNGAAYALGAVGFLARPKGAIDALNRGGGEPLEYEQPGLYHSLAAAYMVTIAALAFAAAADPRERPSLIPPLIAAKAASSAALYYRFKQTGRRGFALASALDGALAGITVGLYQDATGR